MALVVRGMGLGPVESQIEAATRAPEGAPFLSKGRHLRWLAASTLLSLVAYLAVMCGWDGSSIGPGSAWTPASPSGGGSAGGRFRDGVLGGAMILAGVGAVVRGVVKLFESGEPSR